MAPSGGIWAPVALNILKNAIRASHLIRKRLAEAAQRTATASSEPVPILVRNTPRHPISKAAWLRQSKGRWYTTHSTINATVRRFMSTGSANGVKFDRSSFPKSAIGTTILRSTTRAPFSSTLRPNLTGGALPRTAGGYSLGGGRTGGARYFSHTPAAPAQVVNNVSAAVRAFWLSGHKAQFDGLTERGDKRYRTISALQDETSRKMSSVTKATPGSFVDFRFNPTVTALSPLAAALPTAHFAEAPTLNTDGFLDVLSVDFARALKDFTAIMNDLKRLSALGDLSVTLEPGSILRVRFPGCDADTVERLCDEIGVRRGIIQQDPDFDASYGGQVALLFPFASTTDKALSSPGGSLRSQTGHELEYDQLSEYKEFDEFGDNPWLSSLHGYETMEELSETESMYFGQGGSPSLSRHDQDAGYMDGIYRFIENCDGARRM
ncbi:hypothetical protein VE00_02828 [Pseudogymnoascus sp. WSF 3629]|nr:hypothetical protein VE00_02828 [Pseudogymnoascus sp. WSF 3629]